MKLEDESGAEVVVGAELVDDEEEVLDSNVLVGAVELEGKSVQDDEEKLDSRVDSGAQVEEDSEVKGTQDEEEVH